MRAPGPLASRDVELRLATLYGGLFLTIGVQLPFLPVWLAHLGYQAEAIGLILAVPMLVRPFAIPVAAMLTDRFGRLRDALLVCSFLAASAFTLLVISPGLAGIVGAMALAAAASGPLLPLTDAYALRALAAAGRPYGPVRSVGSVAFIFGNLGAGLAATIVSADRLIWLIVAPYWLTVALARLLKPLGKESATHCRARADGATFRVSDLVVIVAASSLIQASHAVLYGFASLDWLAAGLSPTRVGLLWALGVIAEIALFAWSGRLPPWLRPGALVALGGAGACLRWTAMALSPDATMLPVLQALHGLSFGATHLGAVQFLARAAPSGRAATVQGILSVANGIVMGGAMALSGMLHAASTPLAYAVMASAAGAGALLAMLICRQG